MNEAMDAEFDTLAAWTADVAVDLGADHHLPAACKGSGSPAALDWLLDHIGIAPGRTLLDSGAGLGGPSEYARRSRGVRPVLVEPAAAACRGARRLFGLTALRGDAAALPLPDAAVDAAWSLGVLCTVRRQADVMRELVRVTTPPRRIGLLVYVAHRADLPDEPEGNDFPTAERVMQLVARSGLRLEAWQSASELDGAPVDWQRREQAVEDEVARRHAGTRRLELVQRQSRRMAELLERRDVTAELLSLRER